MFSFNSPYGACPSCEGLGSKQEIDPELVLDLGCPLRGGLVPWRGSRVAGSGYSGQCVPAL